MDTNQFLSGVMRSLFESGKHFAEIQIAKDVLFKVSHYALAEVLAIKAQRG